MNAESLDGLRRKLKRRFERLDSSHRRGLYSGIKLLWEFIEGEPLLLSIVNQLVAKAHTDLKHLAYGYFASPEQHFTMGMRTAKTEEETAAVGAILIKAFSVQEVGRSMPREQDLRNALENCNAEDNDVKAFKARFFHPLWDYFQDKLDDLQFLIGRIIQYKHRCEWFERERLMEAVAKAEAANPKHAEVERDLKIDLYRFLHDQGITFFIDPFSYKGKIDLILDQTGERKTYIEGKVFDNKGRGKSEVKKGFGQLWGYMNLYTVSVGYLVVYNTSDHQLVFKGEESESGIAVFRRGHLSIYAVPIEIHLHTTSASERKDRYVEISNSDLPQTLDEPASEGS